MLFSRNEAGPIIQVGRVSIVTTGASGAEPVRAQHNTVGNTVGRRFRDKEPRSRSPCWQRKNADTCLREQQVDQTGIWIKG